MTNNTSSNRSYSSMWAYVFQQCKDAGIMEQNVFKTKTHDKCLKNFITGQIEDDYFWQREAINFAFHIALFCVLYTQI